MSLTLVTAPNVDPITESDVWDHLRVNLTGSPAQPVDKDYIATLISAATAYLDGRDGILSRCLVTQTWDYTLDEFPIVDFIRLPLAPVQSITSIKYTDADGIEQTLSDTKYRLSADTDWRPRIDLDYDAAWPGTRNVLDAVTVRFVAGYASGNSPEDASAVPAAIKAAMKLLIGHWYEHREAVNVGQSVTDVPMTVNALLVPYRRGLIA